MKKITYIILLLFITQWTAAQTAHKLLRNGNSAYKEDDFATAAENYYKALEKDPCNVKGKFNLGNATYQTNGYDEAVKHYAAAAELAKDNSTKADAYYNLGNALFQKAQAAQGEGLDKSVEAYKNALRLNPKDVDTKKNLALTQRLLQRMQQQQQQQQQQDNQEEQQEKEEQQEEQQQQQQQQQQSESQEEQQQQQQQPKDLNKEEALELLKIMDDEEKKVQEKLRKAKGKGKKPDKDW